MGYSVSELSRVLMGIRRKKITDRRREKIKGLLSQHSVRQVHNQLWGTGDQVSPSTIYKIRRHGLGREKIIAPPISDKIVEKAADQHYQAIAHMLESWKEYLSINNLLAHRIDFDYSGEDELLFTRAALR